MLAPQESFHQTPLEKILIQERWVTIGRLIASFVHEINNPLQAIRGALALALDDIEKPRELREYIAISQQELDHITTLLSQLRLIYRSQDVEPELFPLAVVFRDSLDLTREDAMRQKVKIHNLLPDDSPLVEAIYNHIYLVVLRSILAFTDAIGAVGGGELTITAEDASSGLQIFFMTRTPIVLQDSEPGTNPNTNLLLQFDLATSSELVKANGGCMDLQPSDNQLVLRIKLPKVP